MASNVRLLSSLFSKLNRYQVPTAVRTVCAGNVIISRITFTSVHARVIIVIFILSLSVYRSLPFIIIIPVDGGGGGGHSNPGSRIINVSPGHWVTVKVLIAFEAYEFVKY